MTTWQSASVAFLAAAEGTERVELTEPWQAVRDIGGRPVLVSPAPREILVLPGGVANPDQLRTDADAVAFVRGFLEAGQPVAAICHAPWTLIEADGVRDRTLTSWPSLRTDLRNAGAAWVDEQVVVCEKGPSVLVTSRRPQDLPAFCAAFTEVFGMYL